MVNLKVGGLEQLSLGELQGANQQLAVDNPGENTPIGYKNVACLVVNYSTPDDLKRCINSAWEHEGPMFWFVYQNLHPEQGIRDANHRATLEAITGRSQWTMVQSGKENYGHGFGINRAAETASFWVKPDYLFLVNPDVAWTEPVIGDLIRFLEEHPKAAAVGPKQMNSDHRITAGGIFGTMEQPKHRYWLHHDPKNLKARDTFQAPTIAGSAMLVPTKVFNELGGLLESHHYYSETWFNYHAQAHGYEIWYYGEPWMIHEWHRSSPKGSPLSDGRMKEDRELFRKKCDEHDPPIPHD